VVDLDTAFGEQFLDVPVGQRVTDVSLFDRRRSAASLHRFVTDTVAPGARVITDGWPSYRGIGKLGYTHEPRSQRAARSC
jgi:hypothetical protein